MNEIQCITNEWVDILILNNIDKSIRRKICYTEYGKYHFNNDVLIVEWNYWGIEKFIYINGNYINLNDNIYNTQLIDENEKYNVLLNFENNKVYKNSLNAENYIGTFHFKKNNIHILFKDTYKIYKIKDYGKYFISNGVINDDDINKNSINNKTNIKLIAIVFPQYHEFYENNLFWGKGFTEWTLLKKTEKIVKDEYIKHPHKDIGYYNLKDYDHRKYMRILADKYNIYGFCYYHYWFKNKKIMYEPLEHMLKDGEPNKPFFFCWANEQWTRRWDGGNNDILIAQDYSDEIGNINHFTYLLDFFKHHNYIKKNNKPIFIFYRIEEKDVDDIKKIIILWNNLAQKNGFDGIHFMRYLGPFDNKIQIDSIEGFVEFEPGYCMQKYYNEIMLSDDETIFKKNNYDERLYLNKNEDVNDSVKKGILKNGYEHYLNISEEERNFRLSKYFLYNGNVLYNRILDIEKIYDIQHRGISVGWNNIPRRTYSGDEYSKYPHIWKNINIHNFTNCLEKLMEKIDKNPNKINDTKVNNNKDDNTNFLFITAWNEWNEQCVLEPSNIDGYSFLNEINNTYLNFYNNPIKKHILYISHIGGGTDKYIKDLEKIFPEYNFIRFIDKNNDEKYETNNKPYNELYNFINVIHINSIINNENFRNTYDDTINLIYFLDSFESYVKKIITIHDFQWLFPDNPNITLEDFNKTIINNNIDKNIEYFEKILNKCDKIIFPDNILYINYNKLVNLSYYNNKIFIVNHSDKLINYNNLYVSSILDNTINIAFVGNFCEYKGKNVFINISKRLQKYKNYNILYHVFGENNGYSNESNNNEYNNKIILHNKYNDNDIIDLLYKNNIHGIMHLSLFEETYCYALTNSINSGLPILHNNYGVFKNRLGCIEERFIIYQEYNDIYYFLDYIIKNNGIKNINNYISKDLQPNKWYLEHYK